MSRPLPARLGEEPITSTTLRPKIPNQGWAPAWAGPGYTRSTMLKPTVRVANRTIGSGHPVFVIAEIGINHNGSLALAKRMIAESVDAGADAVKFQKRTPELCVPKERWNDMRDTPWGRMTYIDYKHRTELTEADYAEIDRYCRSLDIPWFASCWDEPSVDFIEKFDPPMHKAPSAALTDLPLLRRMRQSGRPLMISTGMSTMLDIQRAVRAIGTEDLMMAQSTSTYPCALDELNLRVVQTLAAQYPEVIVGYSGHETGLAPSYAAVALGAAFVERHVTLDRALWGSDQAASVEFCGLRRLVSNIRDIERALGDGIKRVYASEAAKMSSLRRVVTPASEPERRVVASVVEVLTTESMLEAG